MIPVLGRSPGKKKGYPLQYPGLKNSRGVAKSWTRLSDFHFPFVHKLLTISLTGSELIFSRLLFAAIYDKFLSVSSVLDIMEPFFIKEIKPVNPKGNQL